MNARFIHTLITASLVLALLAGCGQAATEAPTATAIPPTPLPSSTPLPTDTPIPTDTPLPTSTPTPTETPTPEPTATLALPEIPEEYAALLDTMRIELPGGGFSFQAPVDYSMELGLYEARLVSPDTMTEIHLKGSPNIDGRQISEMEMPSEDAPSEDDVGLSINVQQSTIGREPAFQIEMGMMDMITSTMMMATPLEGENTFSGGVVHMTFDLFGGAAGAAEEPPADHRQILAAVLSSLLFFPIPESARLPAIDPAACTYADDPTFGLSEDNPIVLYHYPDYQAKRINEYLSLMTGPNGEEVKRTAGEEGESVAFEIHFGESGTEPVMEVLVTYQGLTAPITLFIQPMAPTTEDDLTQPPIPAGLKCRE